MFNKLFSSPRYALFKDIILCFLSVSLVLRLVFFIWQYQDVSWKILDLLRTLITGLFYDVGTASFIIFPAALYFALLPDKWIGTLGDKVLIGFFTFVIIFVLVLVFFAEITFWDEFRTRFNFIAVDYLIYTHEVVANIEESYPLPLLIGGAVIITSIIILVFKWRKSFQKTFQFTAKPAVRITFLVMTAIIMAFFVAFVSNVKAEWSENRYNSEISKAGIYSFFAAFRNNQMKYSEFYTAIDNDQAFRFVRKKLSGPKSNFTEKYPSVHRKVGDTIQLGARKNVVFILVESLSASFLKEFGNKQNITPFMDSLAQKSILFENIFATGTRTVRGMEAVTLSIPPTPGQSIVKRPENQNLFTVASIFKNKKYDCNFFYGGDGYFDNMNSYFGGNGFTIYDRGRGSVLSDEIKTVRNNIENNEVTFENAWGICDEDIYNKMIRVADKQYAKGLPFFNFIMTTSNHRPYTYPSGEIDIPSGTSREGAVKYTDFALRELFNKAAKKAWYKNTIFVIIGDHCASSAGKDAIDVANYHIPAMIVNLPQSQNHKNSKLCSQIDIFPTLFGLMNWNYETNFFGQDILQNSFEERAFLGTYRKLALMKENKVMILSDQKKQSFYKWDKTDNSLLEIPIDKTFLQETISWYQTADYFFTNKLLK
ncbi:LTA synthase family protein [Flavobacterium sp. NPDC079362]|uniref:Phosphoglycerol transferase I n=1 Tax=Flavobacterium collinsii TaxID=1114861 RepID=A0ABM8KHH7_9FLAO|nr:alkaline phosphatase family protein [Flavobacterium collinsii]CAA9197755.1 Phosphoglycerol transferase I [Flavobacterium collinsii]